MMLASHPLMQVQCIIELDYESREEAEKVAASISLDNGKYASAEVKGNRLVLTASANSAPSMLHTLEDLLSCLKVADEMVKGVEGSGNGLSDLDD
jgi:tRNA threonylcarbamoyladenosine modification (KEOPS) complex  Pcc1 subunit